ncbi:hypothetical protein JL721_12165 [Aureococcus anophagefferens]|nr:hypothetical protein JL721_12165 [Aureococcus anophagefferens]
MTARGLLLLATWARAEWCAVQIANVFGDAPLSVEWRLDAAPDVVAAAAAAVVDELPASAWPAAVEAAVRSTMAAHRANGCAGSPAPARGRARALGVATSGATRAAVAAAFADRGRRRGLRAAARPQDGRARSSTSATSRPGRSRSPSTAGAALRFDAVVALRTDVLWADPSFRLASLAPSRDGVHARYDLYHYARGATFERVFATARAFADRGAARGGGGGFLLFDAAAARASDLSTVRWWWLSLPGVRRLPATPELKAARCQRWRRRHRALGAPAVGARRAVRLGTTGFDHNEAWLVHLPSRRKRLSARRAPTSRLAFNRRVAFGAGYDGVLEVAPT